MRINLKTGQLTSQLASRLANLLFCAGLSNPSSPKILEPVNKLQARIPTTSITREKKFRMGSMP